MCSARDRTVYWLLLELRVCDLVSLRKWEDEDKKRATVHYCSSVRMCYSNTVLPQAALKNR